MRSGMVALALVAAVGIGPVHAEPPSAAPVEAGPANSSVATSTPASSAVSDANDKDTTSPAAPLAAAAPVASSSASAASTPASPPPVVHHVVARIDLTTQRMTVAVDGTIRHTWAVSSGRSGFPTPRGEFRAQWMSRMWYSRKYDLAPMPYSVFFHGGAAIHATSAVGMLGRPASHGCVRLAEHNAAIFYGLVKKYGLASTQVIVTGKPPASRGDDLVASRAPRVMPPLRMVSPRGHYYSRYSYDGSSLRPMPWRGPSGYAGRAFVYPGDMPVRYR